MPFLQTAWMRLCALIAPQTVGDGEPAAIAERETLRRGRLLAALIIISLPLNLCLLLISLFPQPMPAGLAGLAVAGLMQVASAAGNRRGWVNLSCWLFLGAILCGGAVSLLLMPHETILADIPICGFYALPVLQAGFLLDRRAPFLLAGISALLIGTHTVTHAQTYLSYAVLHSLHPFSFGAALIVTIFTLALLSWLNAERLGSATAQADRTEEIERLYADLQASHQALAVKNEEMNAQAQELAAMNLELLAMQSELEASYRKIAEANQHLEEQASTDSMTGLPNHRAFQQALRAQTAQALRHKQPLALLMLDVDYFKQYNDRFGHPAGDSLLREVGGLLSAATRTEDLTARYGGEEFAILLPHTELAVAEQVAERVRSSVESHPFPHDRVTVSIGVAALHQHARGADSLIQAADLALYMAKENGRNRVEVAPMLDPLSDQASTPDGDGPLVTPGLPTRFVRIPSHAIHLELSDGFGGIEGILQEPAGHILTALLAALDARAAETQGHSQRVARYSLRLARALTGIYDQLRGEHPLIPFLSPADFRDLALGALLHDIGKIGVPDYILRKPGPLTEEEWAAMRRHPIIGAELASGLPMLAPATSVIRHHHERWDGQGYPDGLAGEEIPLVARIFAICDTLDSITMDRPYHNARPYAVAREEIERCAGTQFDPLIVQAFLTVPESDWETLRSVKQTALLAAA